MQTVSLAIVMVSQSTCCKYPTSIFELLKVPIGGWSQGIIKYFEYRQQKNFSWIFHSLLSCNFRLVELQNLPWTNHDVLKVIQNGRVKESMDRVAMETIPRLSYLLQRALVRIARETQRLAKPIGMCGKHEVSSALRIILCPILSDSCIKVSIKASVIHQHF